ncbi:phosphate signaling complex protein PhoU [Desulfocurvus sp. DL9XJH121]
MERQFHKQIEELRMKVLHMAAYAERAVQDACKALLTKDVDLAEQVIEKDVEVNRIELEIDEYSLLLLAREQPVARDLRFITGARRVVIDLERIGDEAVNIAEKTIFLSKLPEVPVSPMLEEMVQVAQDMLRLSLEALKEEDPDKAAEVCRMDHKADDLNVRILKKTMDDMVTEVTGVRRAVNTILATRCLERVGDLSTNVAETAIFIAEGVSVKHNYERF